MKDNSINPKLNRVHRSRKYKIINISLITVIVIILLYVILSIFGSVAAMSIPRLTLEVSPESHNLNYENISFFSRGDRTLLKGWFLPSSGDSVVVIVHGGYENRVDPLANTLGISKGLIDHGYSVLLFDLRGRGSSGGKGIMLCNIDRDLGGAIDYLKSRGYSANEIGLMGFCSGAANACIFASEEDVGILVLDGCFTSVHEMVITEAKKRKIPDFLTNFFFLGVETSARILYHYQVVNPIDIIHKVNCPIYFIHEELDNSISMENTYQLFKASTNPANGIWEIDDALHSEGFNHNPSTYISKLTHFLDTRFNLQK